MPGPSTIIPGRARTGDDDSDATDCLSAPLVLTRDRSGTQVLGRTCGGFGLPSCVQAELLSYRPDTPHRDEQRDIFERSCMKRSSTRSLLAAGLVVVTALLGWRLVRRHPSSQAPLAPPGSITIDYPADGSIFPPEFPAPTWLWRDPAATAASWEINVSFADGSPALRAVSAGERMRIGDSDPRCVSSTNLPPALTPGADRHHRTPPR